MGVSQSPSTELVSPKSNWSFEKNKNLFGLKKQLAGLCYDCAVNRSPHYLVAHHFFKYLIDPGCSSELSRVSVACPSAFLKEEISIFWLLHKECIKAFAAITLTKIKKLQHSTPN